MKSWQITIHAPASSRWCDPNVQLLVGAKWEAVKDSVLTDLGLPHDPGEHLAELEEVLDRRYGWCGRRWRPTPR